MKLIFKQFDELNKRFQEDNPLIQIILGPRQVGKTTLARDLFDKWQGPKVMVSADSPAPPKPDWIEFHWLSAREKGQGTLLIIDEIQKVPQWSEQVKILFDQDRNRFDIKVLLLGSSSLYLQKGLSESLAGRFELIHMPHWSFLEFHQAFEWDFDQYLRYGAYPGSISLSSDETRWRSYILNSIIEPVLGKDILALHPVNKPALFRQAFEIAVQYPCYEISYQKMLGQLQERGNAATIKNYLNLLEKSFLIRTLQKYSGSSIRARTSSPKILVLNLALTHAYQSQSRLEQDSDWFGHVFENIVGNHLNLIPNSELYYWRDGSYEVDFVLKTPQKLYGIEIKSGRKKRRSDGLMAFKKTYPKAICLQWNRDDCLRFMTTMQIEGKV
ncbi:MAG: ATP-binding protein [Deltaproteobacteria bacterium]|nr:ATP-binding protein [Deltaproteobacteria bacterium]